MFMRLLYLTIPIGAVGFPICMHLANRSGKAIPRWEILLGVLIGIVMGFVSAMFLGMIVGSFGITT